MAQVAAAQRRSVVGQRVLEGYGEEDVWLWLTLGFGGAGR